MGVGVGCSNTIGSPRGSSCNKPLGCGVWLNLVVEGVNERVILDRNKNINQVYLGVAGVDRLLLWWDSCSDYQPIASDIFTDEANIYNFQIGLYDHCVDRGNNSPEPPV